MQYTYPERVLQDVQKRTGKSYEQISHMKPEEVLNEWLCWQGILCYTPFILSIVNAKEKK